VVHTRAFQMPQSRGSVASNGLFWFAYFLSFPA